MPRNARDTLREWRDADPGNFLLAAILIVGLVAGAVLLAVAWNPWLLVFSLLVFPAWVVLRRPG
jgi:hypothetical protein